MSRRVIGVLVSLALAAIGTWVIINYVNSADERAIDAQGEATTILVADGPIARGTPAADLTGRVREETVRADLAPRDAITSLAQIEGRFAVDDLRTGEAVVASRFVVAEELVETAPVEVPEDLLQVTVELSPDRVLGGELVPGDLIAFVASFQPFTLDAVEPEGTDNLQDFIEDNPTDPDAPLEPLRTPNTSHIIAHKVLVTNVLFTNQQTPTEQGTGLDTGPSNVAPGGRLLVTLAVDAPTVERIVFTAEFGTIWLAKETPVSLEDGTDIQTRGTVYQ